MTYIFMFEPCQYLDFPEGPLTISLMFKWWNFLYGYFSLCYIVVCRSGTKRTTFRTKIKKWKITFYLNDLQTGRWKVPISINCKNRTRSGVKVVPYLRQPITSCSTKMRADQVVSQSPKFTYFWFLHSKIKPTNGTLLHSTTFFYIWGASKFHPGPSKP